MVWDGTVLLEYTCVRACYAIAWLADAAIREFVPGDIIPEFWSWILNALRGFWVLCRY